MRFAGTWERLLIPACDLAANTDAWIAAVRKQLQKGTEDGVRKAVKAMSRHITVAYYLGGSDAQKQTGSDKGISSLPILRLQSSMDSLETALQRSFKAMAGEMTTIIDHGIKDGLGQDEIAKQLKSQLATRYGKVIPFKNAGSSKRVPWVQADGSLGWKTQAISHNTEMSVKAYAQQVSRTASKAAYNEGTIAGLEQAGLNKWVFTCVADGCTRPHHLALHGTVFIVGTEAERMARELMKEPNCRCRATAYFDDEESDRDPKEYAEERKAWALNEQQKYEAGSPWHSFMGGIVSHADKQIAALEAGETLPDREVKKEVPHVVKEEAPQPEPVPEPEGVGLGHAIDPDQSLALRVGSGELEGKALPKGAGHETLYRCADEQGFTGLPTVVSTEDFNRALKTEKYYELYRGVCREEFGTSFKEGQYWAGTGRYGNGTYAAMGKDTARAYIWGENGEKGVMLRLALPKNAKIITYRDAQKLYAEYEAKLKVEYEELQAYKSKIDSLKEGTDDYKREFAEYSRRKQIYLGKYALCDYGQLATLQGYDAIYIEHMEYMVILNRRAVLVQNEVIL